MRRNAILLTTLMILMSLAPLTQATQARSTTCTGSVCINELLPNPAGSDTGIYPDGEWVELYNSGTQDVDLQGWTLEDAGGWVHVIDANSWVGFNNLASPYVLSAGDYAIIAENEQGTLKLNNAGETLYLKDGTSATVHTVTTGTASSDVSKIPGVLATDDFVDSNANTPGGTNGGTSTGPTYTQSELRITEVMPDTFWTNDNETWPGGEWVEIANIGQIAIDLAGWKIEDAAGNTMEMNTTHLVGQGTIIQPGEHRIVAVNGTRTYGLLNNGAGTEQVKLIMPNGDISHQVEYDGPTFVGHSYVNVSSSIPDWGRNAQPLVTSKWPTPAASNPSDMVVPGLEFQLNEIMTNASQDGVAAPEGEWVELHYPFIEGAMQMPIDLSTYTMRSGTGLEIPFDCSTDPRCSSGGPSMIDVGDFLLFDVEVNNSGFLLDNYDSLSLVDSNGDVRQTVSWFAPQMDNVSIIPSDPMMPAAPWMASPHNTPGDANPGQETGGVDPNVELRISEFMPNPIGADSQAAPNDEWVEIVNIGNDSVDVTGWELRSGTGFVLPPLVLAPGQYHVYHLDSVSMSLPNIGGTLKLSDSAGEPVHTVIWEYSAYGMSMVTSISPADPWVMAPWPTPGSPNPVFEQPYSGPVEIIMTEVSAQCSSPENGLSGEWIELFNAGGFSANLSRWSITDEGGDSAAVAPGRLWDRNDDSMLLDPGAFAVLNIEDSLLSNYDETITLMDPNHQAVQVLEWATSSDCETLEMRDGGSETRNTLYPTPGEENPMIQPYDGSLTVKFTRFMPGEIPNRDNDWFEITNTGDSMVDLGGWTISRQRTNGPWNSTFDNLILHPGDSVVLTKEPSNLATDSGPNSIDADTIFGDNAPWLVNSGASLQLIAPDGTVVDAFVYGDGEADIVGWSGLALELPPSDVAGLILMRGDGCGTLPDTNSSADWEYRWMRLGSSLFCDEGIFSTTGSITPVNSPTGSLQQMVDWIGQATTSIHLHVYQFSSPELFVAIQSAVNRGVECTVLLEGGILGDASDDANQRGWADELANAGCEVLWMIEPSGTDAPMAPYRYIHSKVAVADGNSVWIGSGNWKRSTFPLDGDQGNRDSGIIIDSQDIADLVMTRMSWDENESHRHIINHADATSEMGRPTGWTPNEASTDFGPAQTPPPTFEGAMNGRLLTCPDDCIQGLVWLIDQADTSLDLSVQYFDLGWHWGYGDNPLIEAIERAAGERDVQVRLLINGYYVNEDDDIRETVNHFNHHMNMTDGWDVEARLMSPSDSITKLHDKAVIVDGEITLISSINWGSNSALRNREMGIAINHTGLAGHNLALFEADWERMDSSTDTDGDEMPDLWETENGLNRTRSAIAGSTESEQNLDPDGDGLANLLEYENGGNPHVADTDGDCINDGDEVLWAWANSVDASLAVQTPDADLDGAPDNDTVECSSEEAVDNPPIDNPDDDSEDDDEAGPFREDALAATEAKVLLAMVIIAVISLAGVLGMMLMNKRRESAGMVLVDDSMDASQEVWEDTDSKPAPDGEVILDGTSVGDNAESEAREVSVGRDDGVFGAPQLDGFDFPKWSPKEVQDSLDAGWTVEQLREKYDSEQ
ncbi:MAG: lamin tail domain-containing protein [Candidatus Thalassarchaeaceae archaeon]|nr:lamin tail domain-containing protein [Candidatus Thalassarchaeaceae archaeon]